MKNNNISNKLISFKNRLKFKKISIYGTNTTKFDLHQTLTMELSGAELNFSRRGEYVYGIPTHP